MLHLGLLRAVVAHALRAAVRAGHAVHVRRVLVAGQARAACLWLVALEAHAVGLPEGRHLLGGGHTAVGVAEAGRAWVRVRGSQRAWWWV